MRAVILSPKIGESLKSLFEILPENCPEKKLDFLLFWNVADSVNILFFNALHCNVNCLEIIDSISHISLGDKGQGLDGLFLVLDLLRLADSFKENFYLRVIQIGEPN